MPALLFSWLACASPTDAAGPAQPAQPESREEVTFPEGAAPMLVLSVVSGERSKDSRREVTSARAADGVLRYTGPIGRPTRGRSKTGTRTVRLSPDEWADLQTRVRKDLLVDVEEVRSADDYGSYVDLTVTASLDGQTGHVRLKGMTGKAANLEHAQLADRVRHLASHLKQLADP